MSELPDEVRVGINAAFDEHARGRDLDGDLHDWVAWGVHELHERGLILWASELREGTE